MMRDHGWFRGDTGGSLSRSQTIIGPQLSVIPRSSHSTLSSFHRCWGQNRQIWPSESRCFAAMESPNRNGLSMPSLRG